HTHTPAIYTLCLHDALPISLRSTHRKTAPRGGGADVKSPGWARPVPGRRAAWAGNAIASTLPEWRPNAPECPLFDVPYPFNDKQDRKSTRLNSSHVKISYAV